MKRRILNIITFLGVALILSGCGGTYQLTVRVWRPPSVGIDSWLPVPNATVCVGDLLNASRFGSKNTDKDGYVRFTLRPQPLIAVAAEVTGENMEALSVFSAPPANKKLTLVVAEPASNRDLCRKVKPWWRINDIEIKLPERLGG